MISGVVITLQEEDNIEECVKALQEVCSEVIVMDTGSTDNTISIAEQAGATVYQTKWLGYGPTKNFANSKATNDWILSVDADEVLSPGLIVEIQNLKLNQGEIYAINMLTNYCGTWIRHSGWYPMFKKRLFPKPIAKWSDREVHENLEYPNHIQVKKLSGIIHHYSYKNKEDHIQKSDRYALEGAKQLIKEGKNPSIIKKVFGPPFRFFRMYILRAGFLDGKNGFLLAVRESNMVKKRYEYYNKLKNNETL